MSTPTPNPADTVEATPPESTFGTGLRRLLILAAADNVGIAADRLEPGERLPLDDTAAARTEPALVTREAIPRGHKVALRPIPAGAKVIKFGSPIGSATCAIAAGEHVHTHNLKSDYIPIVTYSDHDPHSEGI